MSEPRRAFVLAAGLGTRLRPLTEELPKPAWPFFDVPLAAHILHLLTGAGVEEAIVNLHHLGDRLKEILTPWIPKALQVLWSPEEAILGTGGALLPWRVRLAEGAFFLCNADTIQELDLTALCRFHQERSALATLAVRAAPGGAAPIEVAPDGRIVRFLSARAPGGRPGIPCAFTGVHLLEPEILRHLPTGRFCINADVHSHLVAGGQPLYGYLPPDGAFWSDLGTPDRYLAAHRAFLTQGRLPPGAPGQLVREDARKGARGGLRAPSYVGPGADVKGDAVVGPFAVVGADSVIDGNAEVLESVIWAGSRLTGGRVERAIVSPSGIALSGSGSGAEEGKRGRL